MLRAEWQRLDASVNRGLGFLLTEKDTYRSQQHRLPRIRKGCYAEYQTTPDAKDVATRLAKWPDTGLIVQL